MPCDRWFQQGRPLHISGNFREVGAATAYLMGLTGVGGQGGGSPDKRKGKPLIQEAAGAMQLQGMRNRLQEAEDKAEKVQKEYQSSLSTARAESGTLEAKVKRLEKEAATNRATHQAELQDLRTSLKKAQVRSSLCIHPCMPICYDCEPTLHAFL